MMRVIRSHLDVDALALMLKSRTLPVTISIADGDIRSKDQNDLQFKWLTEAAQQLGHDVEELRLQCKLEVGVPILRSEDADFRATYDRVIRPLPYAEKLEAMRILPVTSIMTTRQKSSYLDALYRRFSSQGVALTVPGQ